MNGWSARDIKTHIKEIQEPLRRFLSGELRLALLRILDEVIDDLALDLYAALYELSDDELIGRLKLLAGRAHVILANGSDQSGDGNSVARLELENAQVDVHDRLLGSKGLGHNKFAVVVRRTGRVPLRAWTGSTNWASTGLCTQLNNGIQFDGPAVATLFLDQWDRLAAAGSSFPASLVQANAQSPRAAGNVDVWFTRVRNKSTHNVGLGSDLQELVDLVNGANEVVLYVMFQPGPQPLTTILLQAAHRYVRGVVSTVTSTNQEAFRLAGIADKEYRTALVQPEGIGKDFAWWVKEVTRAQFLTPLQNPGIGHAITHAKMIVIDPLSANCVVITGSHNFSGSASEGNDDNFVVVRGDRALAEAYSVACLSTYRHYRWRAYVKDMVAAGKSPWSHLSTSPGWQSAYLTPARRAHLATWCP
jgi:phosphatidylserine/phosphatidylglycerophosphate/cardiolipin synthase-like enzyme